MTSNMTTSEKLKHPVAAVKEMLGKGHGHETHAHDGHNEHGVLGGHNEHPIRGVTQVTPINQTNEEQLNVEGGGLGGTPTLGTATGTGARPVFSEAGTAIDPHDHHKGNHAGAGIGGATANGLGAHEAERHLGQHGQHVGTGHHVGTGVGGAGLGGVGAYEAEKHVALHNPHNDAEVLAGQPGLPGTTGTRGEVYTPHDQRPRNVGLNVIGMDTPLNTSDYRSYPAETAQSAPHIHTSSNIDEERLNKTSLPANPLMSALTGGKIPPSIHKGVEQAGATNATGGVNTGTGAHGAHHTGAHNPATGAYDTTHAGNRDYI